MVLFRESVKEEEEDKKNKEKSIQHWVKNFGIKKKNYCIYYIL